MSEKDQIINELSKIEIYAELMSNISTGVIELNGNTVVRMGAEIIDSIKKIIENIEKTI